MQNDWAGRARLSHALLSLTAGKPVKVRRAGRCACIFQAVAQTPTEAQAPEYLGGCLRAGAPYMGSSRSSGRLCDSLIYALSTAPPDVRSCRCERVSICGACRGRGAGRTLIFKQLMVQRRAAVLRTRGQRDDASGQPCRFHSRSVAARELVGAVDGTVPDGGLRAAGAWLARRLRHCRGNPQPCRKELATDRLRVTVPGGNSPMASAAQHCANGKK